MKIWVKFIGNWTVRICMQLDTTLEVDALKMLQHFSFFTMVLSIAHLSGVNIKKAISEPLKSHVLPWKMATLQQNVVH